jgi:hypothetical protein
MAVLIPREFWLPQLEQRVGLDQQAILTAQGNDTAHEYPPHLEHVLVYVSELIDDVRNQVHSGEERHDGSARRSWRDVGSKFTERLEPFEHRLERADPFSVIAGGLSRDAALFKREPNPGSDYRVSEKKVHEELRCFDEAAEARPVLKTDGKRPERPRILFRDDCQSELVLRPEMEVDRTRGRTRFGSDVREQRVRVPNTFQHSGCAFDQGESPLHRALLFWNAWRWLQLILHATVLVHPLLDHTETS